MSTGLIWFIVLALLVPVFTIVVVGFLNYRENPLYRRAMLKMLKVGQVRANMLSQEGEGHCIFVVKEIDYKKKVIISDTYILKGDKYVLDIKDKTESFGDFYRHTDPEPVYKEERVWIIKN
jgi:hypothetical protein